MFITTEAIFSGKVISLTKDEVNGVKIVEIQINKIYKGVDSQLKNIKLRTGLGGSDCGLNINLGEEWLLWGNYVNGLLESNICTKSSLISSAKEVISFLNKLGNRNGDLWYLNNELVGKGNLNNGLAVGEWKFYRNGKIRQTGQFKFGKEDGVWCIYNTKSNKIWEVLYDNGHELSLKNFFNNGLVSHYESYALRNDLHDKLINYWQSGKIKEIVVNKGSSIYSKSWYYQNGKIALLQTASGINEIYDQNGMLLDIGEYEVFYDEKKNNYLVQKK